MNSVKKLAWEISGEGTAGKDVLITLMGIANTRNYKKLPDIFTAVGKDIFVHNFYGGKIYRNNIWKKIGPHPNSNNDFKELEDDNGILRILYCVNFIFSCQLKEYDDIPEPKSWMDLLLPCYKRKIFLPSLNLPIIPGLLGALYHFYGEENFIKFANNCHNDIHPAGVSPRRRKNEIPGIFILPVHFAKLSVHSGGRVVYPTEGSVAVPSFVAVKESSPEDSMIIANYLSQLEFLEILHRCASLQPNHKDFEVDSRLKPFISRPWKDVLENNPQAYTIRLIQMIKNRRRK